jgi:adenine/guanine phosphoribosyltransferase-like PRPP-binding protein
MIGEGHQERFLDACETKLEEYAADKDVVVINGWQRGGFSINAALARQFDAPVLLCMDYVDGDTPSSCLDRAVRASNTLPVDLVQRFRLV